MKRIKIGRSLAEFIREIRGEAFSFIQIKYDLFQQLVCQKKELQRLETELPIYIVIVQMDRKVSNAIEEDLGVKHESPQLLILKDGKGIWQATHYHIKNAVIRDAIEMYV